MLQATQDRHGPLETPRAFAGLLKASSGGGHGGGASSSSRGSTSGSSWPDTSCSSNLAGNAGPHDGSSSSSSGGRGSMQQPVPDEEPAVLLPFTDELRGCRRFAMDLQGRVWLASGWHPRLAADSLHTLIRRVLT